MSGAIGAAKLKPNLFIVGGTKCASTSLHNWLARHPAFCMSSVKEPGYFLNPAERHPAIQASPRSDAAELELYLGLFRPTESTIWLGESSTAYTHLPSRSGVVERIHQFNPASRIVYLVRDPAVRTVSHYWWNVRHEHERRTLTAAIRDDARYRNVSNYAMQLQPYLEAFGPDQVRLLVLEEITDPQSTSRDEFLRWLGVERTEAMGDIRRDNKTPDAIVQSRSRWIDAVRFSATWDRASRWIPKSLKAAARSLSERQVDRNREEEAAVLQALRIEQRAEIARLSELVDREFRCWPGAVEPKYAGAVR